MAKLQLLVVFNHPVAVDTHIDIETFDHIILILFNQIRVTFLGKLPSLIAI